MSFEFEPLNTNTIEKEKHGLILYARCFDEMIAQNYISIIKPYVSKILLEFDAPNVSTGVPTYRVYILEKDADNVIGLFEKGKRVDL